MHEDFARRRKNLLKAMGEDGIAIIPSSNEKLRNGDAHYKFRQDSNFYYLTGFQEPDAVTILAPNHSEGEFIVFNRKRDKEKEIWHGHRQGQEGVCEHFGADSAFAIDELKAYLPKLLTNRKKIYYELGMHQNIDKLMVETLNQLRAKVRTGIKAPDEIYSLSALIDEMRLIKSDYELESMQYAVDISILAHQKAMKLCKPGLSEYHVDAIMQYEFLKNACQGPAYTSIVGGGANSCILHYIENDKPLNEGELLLIDAAAEFNNYSADITRTFPINGKFSAEQKAIYEIVLAAQKKAIEMTEPGLAWNKIQEAIVPILTDGLIDVGILKGKRDDLIQQKAYFQFYMHNSGHWLGLDTHDVGSYKVNKQWRPLEKGMVLTIEPGIYIQAADNVDEKWWNMGVRIEDDIVVTKTGCDVLSKALIKEVADIEAYMAQ